MSLDERMLDVIQTLYDAALDETLWPQALQQLSDFTGSQAATFWVLDGSEEPRLPIFTYINLDPGFVQEYLERVAPLDPTVQYLIAHPNQPIVHDGLVITEREKDLHPYYDWHGRYSDLRFRVVGQVSPAPGVQVGVALHRTRKTGRYESRDLDTFAVLYRHLERALRLGFRMGDLSAVRQWSTELLDRSGCALVLVDAHKRLVYANRRAEALQVTADGIRLARSGVTLACKEDDDRLQRLIERLVLPGSTPAAGSGGLVRARKSSHRRPYLIVVTPMADRFPLLTPARPAVCIAIHDPDTGAAMPPARLQAAFGLTAAEARLAALLAGGSDLRSAAEALGITYGTARARLAQIFEKTETRRQAELIALLLTTLG